MLGKVIKHEFRRTWRAFAILLAAVALLGILTKITGVFDTFINISFFTETELMLLSGIGLVLLGLASWVVIAAMVIIIRRYFAGMYGEEAYLTHTLPTAAWEAILGRFICYIVWLIACTAVSMASILVASLGVDWAAVIDGVATIAGQLYTVGLGRLVSGFAVNYVIEYAADIFLIFLAVSFACQTFTKGRFVTGLLSFIALSVAMNKTREFISGLLHISLDFTDYTLSATDLTAGCALSVITALVFAAAAFFCVNYLVTKRLNLE